MALVEISNFPGTPKLRCRVPNGTLFYDWLAANDATFHRDLLIVRNGVKLGDDDELAFELSELDHIQIFDQPKGIVGDILSPIFKVVGQVFSFLAPKPAIANNGGNTVDSPNNSLTGQTNTARVYKAKPDIYGQIRSFPDLIQESVFEYVHQTSTDGGLKYVTEWMCIGIGKYDYESVRYSESSLGSLAGAEFQFFQPGEVIPQIVEGYGFDDVDGQEVPGQNEASDFPVESATATSVVSGTYSGGQIAMKIVKQAEFDYFMGLVLPHAVTFTINVTYNTASGSVTTDATFSGTLISAVETNDGAVVNPVRWYTFTMNQLEGPQDIPVNATINTTKFILNDNEALVVGPFFSPVESTQLWLHTQSSLGGKKETNWKVVIWKIDDDYNQVPGTQQTFTYRQTTPHQSTSEVFYRTDKIT
ncbi:TPA: phage tail protein, partial [Enterobacter hormaechei]|nr:MoaD/ThiS family protein [Enterobacter hormaechei subsp. steigerwaltii]HBK4669868.1 MoaD/ThiS family protein [Enterobacter hormaechei subsp. steigerwaltii]HBK4686328.1 MoaD/ThiS family protein [Enterobacter hormaechei subsp. steigerwaltii]HBK4705800.1 MoaD/ThiS family protein [Enterobacter hormaechei subsp. steigerwaltii]HBK4715682.1 MoaD/ThiS family protein [Enterobacter hormaechei subsp. steigerwaltii]